MAEIPQKGVRDIGENAGDFVGQWFGEDGGQSGRHVVNADGVARDGAIDEDENGSDVVDVLPDMSCNTLIVELVLLKTASVDQSRMRALRRGYRVCEFTNTMLSARSLLLLRS